MKFVRNTTLLGIILGATSLFAQAPTMADAQKAYVAGQWKEAATAYEQVCPTVADTAKTECYLWSILALSQTGSADDFRKSGRRLDSLIKETNPQKSIYSDLLMTRAQFQMYLGKFDNAGKALISAIETSGPQQRVALQKVCSAVQPRAKSAMLDSACAKLNVVATPEAPVTAVSTPAAVAAPATSPAVPAAAPAASAKDTTTSAVVVTAAKDSAKPTAPVAPSSSSVAVAIAVSSETAVPQPETATPSANTTAKTESAPAVAVPSQDKWALQLGAFGVKSNAELLVKNMKKRGVASQIEERAGATKTLYIVFIPGFTTKEAAVDYGAQKLAPIKVDFQPVKRK